MAYLKPINPEIPIHRSHVSGVKWFIRVWRDRQHVKEMKELKDKRVNFKMCAMRSHLPAGRD